MTPASFDDDFYRCLPSRYEKSVLYWLLEYGRKKKKFLTFAFDWGVNHRFAAGPNLAKGSYWYIHLYVLALCAEISWVCGYKVRIRMTSRVRCLFLKFCLCLCVFMYVYIRVCVFLYFCIYGFDSWVRCR